MTLSADRYLVACGTRPLRRPDVPFDGSQIFDSDQLLWGGVDKVPRDLIVIGAGVIGMEYASMQVAFLCVVEDRRELRGVGEWACHSCKDGDVWYERVELEGALLVVANILEYQFSPTIEGRINRHEAMSLLEHSRISESTYVGPK